MKVHIITFFSLFSLFSLAQPSPEKNWDDQKMEVVGKTGSQEIIHAHALFEEDWDQLAQPRFWAIIMRTSPDTILLNVSTTRQILDTVATRSWRSKSDAERNMYKDSLRNRYGVSAGIKINETVGKSDFYQFHKVYASLGPAIQVFEEQGVDPWYAQSILLIESPGQLLKSTVGAYGPFQLMPSVAKAQGLIVSATKDERADLKRSAYAAANVLKNSMIPSAKKILKQHGLSFNENDIWFRLLVLHVYHAGAGNVSAVLNAISPSKGGQELIQKMWVTSAAGFGNNSQNYSQLALAAHLLLNDLVHRECTAIHPCSF
jgi:hypothetical protein